MGGRALRPTALIILAALTLGALPASSECFMTADKFVRYMKEEEPNFYAMGAVIGFIQGVFDVYSELGRVCPSEITAGDAETLARRHFQAVMDAHDMLPSRTCAEDVLMRIFMDRFPCQPPKGDPT